MGRKRAKTAVVPPNSIGFCLLNLPSSLPSFPPEKISFHHLAENAVHEAVKIASTHRKLTFKTYS